MSQTYAVRKQCGGGTRLSFANCGSDCRRFISPLRSINENRRESARSQEVQHLHGPLPETGSVKTKLWSLVIFFIWYVGWWVPSNGPCCRQKVMIPFQPVRGSPPEQLDSDCTACSITAAFVLQLSKNYPLVNVKKTMESHHVQWENPLFLCTIFNSYFDITRGYPKWRLDSFSHLLTRLNQVGWLGIRIKKHIQHLNLIKSSFFLVFWSLSTEILPPGNQLPSSPSSSTAPSQISSSSMGKMDGFFSCLKPPKRIYIIYRDDVLYVLYVIHLAVLAFYIYHIISLLYHLVIHSGSPFAICSIGDIFQHISMVNLCSTFGNPGKKRSQSIF